MQWWREEVKDTGLKVKKETIRQRHWSKSKPGMEDESRKRAGNGGQDGSNRI